MNYALIAIALNTVLALAMFPILGFLSVAISTSIAAWVQVILLAQKLYRRRQFQPGGRLGVTPFAHSGCHGRARLDVGIRSTAYG